MTFSPEKPKKKLIPEKDFLKAVQLADGNQSEAARKLGIDQSAISHRLNRHPEIKKKILDAREKALKAASISRARVYKKIAEGLEATKTMSVEDSDSKDRQKIHVTEVDFKERREAAKICLQLFGDLESGQDSFIDQSVKNYVQIYRPENYPQKDMDSASRAADRSI